MRPRTGCMPRRASWPGASARRTDPVHTDCLRRLAKRALNVHIEPMSEPDTGIPVREPAATSVDDTILPFAVEALEVRGRVVRLGPLVDTILRSHAYPPPVARLLGEAIV